MIIDKILGSIVGKDEFNEEEYARLREEHSKELDEKWAEIKAQKEAELEANKPKPIEPVVDKTKLEEEKTKLEEELSILKSQGYQKLLEAREEKSIQNRLDQIIKQVV
jgi:hypothetical protein